MLLEGYFSSTGEIERKARDALLSLVLLSLSQKLIVPSLPAVENVPYGWNWMSLTAYTLDDLDGAGSSLRWHCERVRSRA